MERHLRRLFAVVCLTAAPTLLSAQSHDTAAERAERGDAEAQFELGARYAMGDGVQQSYEEAIRWYRRAARRGNAKAQYNLGINYADGMVLPQSRHKATRWLRRAARQGYEAAQRALKEMNETW